MHNSVKTGNTEYKSRVHCTGSGWKTVDVRVRGGIYFYPAKTEQTVPGKQQVRALSDKTQTITLNAKKITTFYTPDVGKSGGHRTGFWFGTSTGQTVSPMESSVGVKSQQVWASL